ncbi:MAG: hypothetical protein ACOC2K_03385 [Bacteroidota bacterium]
MKLIKLNRLKRLLKPRSYFEELAEYGLLESYLSTFFSDKYQNDEDFKNEMIELLYRHSQSEVAEVEKHYMQELIRSLSYFNEYTRQCREQKQ